MRCKACNTVLRGWTDEELCRRCLGQSRAAGASARPAVLLSSPAPRETSLGALLDELPDDHGRFIDWDDLIGADDFDDS